MTQKLPSKFRNRHLQRMKVALLLFLTFFSFSASAQCNMNLAICFEDCPSDSFEIVNLTIGGTGLNCTNRPNPNSQGCFANYYWSVQTNGPTQYFQTNDLSVLTLPISWFNQGVGYQVVLQASPFGQPPVASNIAYINLPPHYATNLDFTMNGSLTSPIHVCPGQPVVFNDVSVANVSYYNPLGWYFGDGSTAPPMNSVQHTYSMPGTYTAGRSYELGNNNVYCGIDTVEKVVIVSNINANFSWAPACAGQPMQFTNLSTGPGTSYLWDFGDQTQGNTQNPAHTYTNPGTYTVTLTVSNGFCSGTYTQQVTVGGTNFNINGLTNFCTSTGTVTSTHVASVTGQGITYSWSAIGGNIPGSTTGAQVQTQWGMNGGTLCCVLTNANTGCSTQRCINITVSSPPNAAISGPTTLCSGNTLQYSPAAGAAFVNTYTWTVTPAGGQSPYTINGPFINVTWPPQGGSLCLNVFVTGGSQTCQSTQCINVVPCCAIQTNPIVTDECAAQCDGSIALTGISGGTAPYSFSWNTGATSPSIFNLCAGNYTVTVSDAQGCVNTSTITVGATAATSNQGNHVLDLSYSMPSGERVYFFDMDFDGNLDLISCGEPGATGVGVRLGLGNGQFANTVINVLPNINVQNVDYADMDGDLVPDLVCMSWQTINVLRNTSFPGTLVYTPIFTTTPPTGGWIGAFELKSLDGNASNDVVFLDGQFQRMYIYLNNGNGTLTLTTPTGLVCPPAISYWESKIVDINNDNLVDIVFDVAGGSNTVHAFLNQGAGVFLNGGTAEVDYVTGGDWIRGIHLADLNNDNQDDIIAASQLTQELLINFDITNFNPTWATYPILGQPVGIDVADMNNDGSPDILVANASGSLHVLLNNGSGVFTAHAVYSTFGQTTEVVIGDLSGDCCLDFAVVNRNNPVQSNSVYLNTCIADSILIEGDIFCADANCNAGAVSSGTSVVLGDGTTTIATTTTDANGHYSFFVANNTTAYTITPTGVTFATNCGAGPITGFDPIPTNGVVPGILIDCDTTCTMCDTATLIVNQLADGDFEQGLALSCGLVSQTCLDESVWVGSEPRDKCTNILFIDDLWDHTLGTQNGHFLIVDGFNPNTQQGTVWCDNVNVVTGTEYQFSFWEIRAVSTNMLFPATQMLETHVNGNVVGTFNINNAVDITQWMHYCSSWLADTTGMVTIEIVEVGGTGYNDYGIDDIVFGTCGFASVAEEVIEENEFTVYPNPANESVTIDFETGFEGTIEILNLQGQMVAMTEVDFSQKSVTFDTSTLPSGTYLIRSGSIIKRFVVSHS